MKKESKELFEEQSSEEEAEEAEAPKEIPKKKVSLPLAEITEVPSQMTRAFKLPNGDVMSFDEFLVEMYNRILKIERAIV